MRTTRSKFSLAATAALVLIGARVLAAEGPSPEAVESATTAADHNKIADAYQAEAKEYRDSAARHVRAGRAYGKGPAYRRKGAGAAAAHAMSNHCERVSASFKAAAEQSETLANAHRQLAAESK